MFLILKVDQYNVILRKKNGTIIRLDLDLKLIDQGVEYEVRLILCRAHMQMLRLLIVFLNSCFMCRTFLYSNIFVSLMNRLLPPSSNLASMHV